MTEPKQIDPLAGAVCVDGFAEPDEPDETDTVPAPPAAPTAPPAPEALRFAAPLKLDTPPPTRTEPGTIARAAKSIRRAAEAVREIVAPSPDPVQAAIAEGRKVRDAYRSAMAAAGLTNLPPETLRAVCSSVNAPEFVSSEALGALRARAAKIDAIQADLATADFLHVRREFKRQLADYSDEIRESEGIEGALPGSWPEYLTRARQRRKAIKGACRKLVSEQVAAVQPVRNRLADACDRLADEIDGQSRGLLARLAMVWKPTPAGCVVRAVGAWFRLSASGVISRDLPWLSKG